MVLRKEIQQIIEAKSDPTSREVAEHLIDSGKVHISTLNDSFIRGRVDEVGIELHLKTNSLNLETNCGCLKKNEKLCRHGLAFLLQLMNQLQSSQPSKGVKFWRQMVRDMDQSDLKRLVIDFARRNKTFAMELQALNVASPGENSPYEMAAELLDTIRQPIIRSVKKPASTHVRLTVNTCKSLYHSARDLVNGDHPVEGSKIFLKIIETLHYLAHKRQALDATSGKLINKCQEEIIDRLRALRGPEVNEEFYNHIIGLISKSYFAPLSLEFIPDLFGQMKLPEHHKGFLEAIESHIDRSEGLDKDKWLNIWLQCMTMAKLKEPRPFVPDAGERLVLWKLFSRQPVIGASETLLELLYENVPVTYRNEAFNIALSGEHWNHVINILQYPGISMEDIRKEQAELLLEEAEARSISLHNEYTLALMEVSENIDRLSSLVKEQNTLEVTAEIIHLNTKENDFICADLLKEQIDEFLIHHIGPASREIIHKLLEGLKRSENNELYQIVKDYLRDRYDIQNESSLKSITSLLQ